MKFNKFRKWSRIIHRDLSFFFSGMLIIYAISGIAMNHLKTYNPNFSIELKEYVVDQIVVPQHEITKEYVIQHFLVPINEEDNYTKHYFPKPKVMKVFLKGGSNLMVNIENQEAIYESVKPRYIMSAMARLHYNPGKWWTTFADVFAVGIIVIILSGLVMVKGRRGLLGIGGLELFVGMLIPIVFLLFF